MAISFEHLRDFIRTLMRMAPIYQPVMIKELAMPSPTLMKHRVFVT